MWVNADYVQKERKIGCDRGLPACNNCLRTGRECLGYGIRLAWPDQPDGRRRKSQTPDQAIQLPAGNSKHYGRQFLNVNYDDVARASNAESSDRPILYHRSPQPQRLIPLIPNLHEREPQLIYYYEHQLSRMVSTIDVNNGFREYILPLALSPYNPTSEGLRNAMISVAAFHLLGHEAALPFKAKAIQSLSWSLSGDSVAITETQLATSMMLCVYNVFDESEGHWALHLKGANAVLHKLMSIRNGYPESTFLYTWFLYHEVLGEFGDPQSYYPEGPTSLQLKDDLQFDTSLIVGSLGCSVEVMEIISFINGLRARELNGDTGSPTTEDKTRRNEEWHIIESRLANLEQRLDPVHVDHLTQYQRTMIRSTAELYRLATFLYLQRTCNTAQVHELRTMYLDQAFKVLNTLETCSSPWPLFVLACEAEVDEQRIEILQALDKMDTIRRIGNIKVLRDIIETFWKHQDLQADSGRSPSAKWWDVLDLNIAAPWFI
ncbi:fungal-specific transcription factor domain-containing protein [Truncatella angustata]|uniref:Fungal-specific transcription factor domain-containing protein n=1 Tax=Truncatella angustata TaxID=152316 RepID=A0A9P8UIP6_9PEZI|nr:fungal-specific transcription factor domain-containing protein [Truncatella angustata]KAH6652945.1 fungal-specific transcription factor domain-containing protein [Truncatella angustata]